MAKSFQLAIESSGARASMALARDGKVVSDRTLDAGARPSEALLVPLQDTLNQWVEGEIEVVLVGTGPGSYNGARVGIAAGQGVAIVHECPVVGLSSLEGLATVRAGGACLALGDARRGHYFTVEITRGRISSSPDLTDHLQFVSKVRERSEAGVRLLTLETVDRLKLPADLGEQVEVGSPTARLLLDAWASRTAAEREEIARIPPEPYYLRPPHITQAGERGRASGV